MAKFVKLGPKAGGFTDPYSRFKIALNEVKELKTSQEKFSGKIKAAIRGGHLVVCSQKEYDDYLKSLQSEVKPLEVKIKTLRDKLKSLEVENKKLKEVQEDVEKDEEDKELTSEEKFNEMTKEEMIKHYKDSYEVREEEVEAFGKLKHGEMVVELLELENED